MNPKKIAAILGIATLGSAGPGHGETVSVMPSRWTSRVLVISAPDPRDPKREAQRRNVAAAEAGAAERDLVIVEAVGLSARAQGLRRRFGLPDDAFRAVLVGKDGEAKMTEAEPISSATLFATIDAMPMRQDERQRSGRR